MESQYSPKEMEVFGRFLTEMQNVEKNPNQSIGTRIEKLATEMPNKKALCFEGNSWTWHALNEESNKIANYFLSLELKPGDTIALMLENSPEYLFLTSGINKIQGVSALINSNQKKQALLHAFKTVGSKWIIVDGDCLPSFNEIVQELPLKKDRILVLNNPENIPHDFIDLPSEIKSKSISKTNPDTTSNSILRQTALYIFSSGTTGLPKAIIMQNYRLYYQTLSVVMATCQLSSSDVIYIAMPLYHNLAIGMSWIASVLSGAGVALRKRFSASEFWKDIHKHHATFMMYVGEIPRYLLNQPPSEYEKNHTLKKVAGVGLRKSTWEKFKSRFQIDHIYEFYGITEGTGGFLNVDEVPGMVGRNNLPGIVLAKVDPETGKFYRNEKGFCMKCEPGDIGMALNELGKDTFFTGYKDKEKTQKKLMYNVFEKNDAYFNTGDMLKLHENLWVSFADRFGDTFRWKGENVSTLEVETILNSYPSIQMCAVYGVAIPNTEGKAGMATVKLNPSTDFEIEDFSRFVVNVLPRYSIPIFFRIKNELELTGPLKIRKTNLRREAYDVNSIQDPLFFWDSSTKKYVALDKSIYQKILEGKLKV